MAMVRQTAPAPEKARRADGFFKSATIFPLPLRPDQKSLTLPVAPIIKRFSARPKKAKANIHLNLISFHSVTDRSSCRAFDFTSTVTALIGTLPVQLRQ